MAPHGKRQIARRIRSHQGGQMSGIIYKFSSFAELVKIARQNF